MTATKPVPTTKLAFAMSPRLSATATRRALDARTRPARSRSPQAPRPPPPARNAGAGTPRARELPAGSPAARSGTGHSIGRVVQILSLAPCEPRMRRSWGSGNAEPRLAFFIHAGVVRGRHLSCSLKESSYEIRIDRLGRRCGARRGCAPPATADAGWRGGYWGGGWGPGFGIYVGPRPYYRNYGYGYGYGIGPIITTVTPIAMGRAGNIVAAGISPREAFLPGASSLSGEDAPAHPGPRGRVTAE